MGRTVGVDVSGEVEGQLDGLVMPVGSLGRLTLHLMFGGRIWRAGHASCAVDETSSSERGNAAAAGWLGCSKTVR